ncbi:MAG: ABC transporter substrate-binding protein [Pseudomonadota bacterium]
MHRLVSAAFAACLATSAQANTIEIMHFWVSRSESAALSVFAEHFERDGGRWIEDPQPNAATLSEEGFARIREGFPPSAMQWAVSPDLGDLVTAGITVPLAEVADPESIARLAPFILEPLTFDGQIAALPIGLHGNNWSFYNAETMARFGFSAPTSWGAMFDQMDTIADAGVTTIAIGSGRWELTLVLDALALNEGGTPILRQIRDGRVSADARDGLERAFSHLIRYVDLVHRSGLVVDTWDAASLAVAQGRATVQVMGDWAKGELVAAGFVPQRDFLCSITPNPQNQLLVTLDAFVLPHSDLAEDRAAQQRFAQIALDPVNQAAFAGHKGALPVVQDVDITSVDICTQRGIEAISQERTEIMRVTAGANPAVEAAMQTVIDQVWDQEFKDGAQAVTALEALYRIALGEDAN